MCSSDLTGDAGLPQRLLHQFAIQCSHIVVADDGESLGNGAVFQIRAYQLHHPRADGDWITSFAKPNLNCLFNHSFTVCLRQLPFNTYPLLPSVPQQETIINKKGDAARSDISLVLQNLRKLRLYYIAAPEAAPCILTSTFSVRPA
mgnify:CR=1 FL=1